MITKVDLDFDSRLTSPVHLKQMHRKMADEIAAWIESQTIFQFKNRFDVEASVAEFYEMFLAAPFRDQFGGSRYNNALWLYLISKALAPRLIIDSGTYTGASAWALASGSPTSGLMSFDIDLSHLKMRVPQCRYSERDWSTEHYAEEDAADGLCYFDDHVDQARRLLEASKFGFRYAVFDDDYPISSFAPMAHAAISLPKVEFALDKTLLDKDEVKWMAGSRQHTWSVDRAYLDRALATIEATDRLPNTSLITGIHQTPYRVIRFRQPPHELG
jgi:hypothetical protein